MRVRRDERRIESFAKPMSLGAPQVFARVREMLTAAVMGILAMYAAVSAVKADEVTKPPVELTINDRHLVIPRDYVDVFSKNPPSVELFVRWPTFGPFPRAEVARKPNASDWSGLLIVVLDGTLANVLVHDAHHRQLSTLGNSVPLGERYGLQWGGEEPGLDPYDSQEFGTLLTADGTVISSV